MRNNIVMKHIKIFEDFNQTTIPEILKKISNIIRIDLINNKDSSFTKNYIIDSFDIKLEIKYIKNTKKPYYSKINIFDILLNPSNTVDIIVNVEDITIDIDYLLSIIIHEIRHIYDIYTINNENEMYDFVKSLKLDKQQNAYFNFNYCIYLSLEHELLARNNMIYPAYRWSNFNSKEELINVFKTSFIYKALLILKDFDSIKYIKSFNLDILIIETNKFIKDIANDNNFCENQKDICDFYYKFETYFKNKYDEYLNYAYTSIDDVINDIDNNIIYEEFRDFSFKNFNPKNILISFRKVYKDIFNIKN